MFYKTDVHSLKICSCAECIYSSTICINFRPDSAGNTCYKDCGKKRGTATTTQKPPIVHSVRCDHILSLWEQAVSISVHCLTEMLQGMRTHINTGCNLIPRSLLECCRTTFQFSGIPANPILSSDHAVSFVSEFCLHFVFEQTQKLCGNHQVLSSNKSSQHYWIFARVYWSIWTFLQTWPYFWICNVSSPTQMHSYCRFTESATGPLRRTQTDKPLCNLGSSFVSLIYQGAHLLYTMHRHLVAE